MPHSIENLQTGQWLTEEFAASLAGVFEAEPSTAPDNTAAPRPRMDCKIPSPSPPANGLAWKQPFSELSGALWLVAAEADWTAMGTYLVRVSDLGLDATDTDTVKSSYFEALNQALVSFARAISVRLAREIKATRGQLALLDAALDVANDAGVESGSDAGNDADAIANVAPEPASPPISSSIFWSSITFEPGSAGAESASVTIFVGCEPELLHSLQAAPASRGELSTKIAVASADKPSTFDRLLDVELPVSVSFGSTRVALKDVLKLTSGSIVELHRTITEPVDVLVNNCIVARGEVVVVEGNFGVRIQQVVSRQERMRTFH